MNDLFQKVCYLSYKLVGRLVGLSVRHDFLKMKEGYTSNAPIGSLVFCAINLVLNVSNKGLHSQFEFCMFAYLTVNEM